MNTSHQFFCVVANGLERAVELELKSMDLPAFTSKGGVYTRCDDSSISTLTRLRTPTSIRWQLLNGRAVRSLSDFRKLLGAIDWSVFPQNSNLHLQVSTRKSKLNRSDILEDKARRILTAILGKKREEKPILPVVIRLFENKLWVSVALHDRPLHQRGWRAHNVKTPIRENWAQCLNWLAGCTGREAIWDPFCGSGTILIEAGMRFANTQIFQTAPWLFDAWQVDWTTATFPPSKPRPKLLGSDRDALSVDKAQQNARTVSVSIESVVADVRTVMPKSFKECPDTGIILCNPPYGMGSGHRTDAVYHWLGETHRLHFSKWELFFIATDFKKASLVSKTAKSIAQFSNAGIPVTFYKA